MSDQEKEREGLSRRQFLTYALGGTGAFMAAAVTAPMIPFVVDPLKRAGESGFIDVAKTTDFEIGTPKRVDFSVKKKDGWVESEAKMSAWVLKQSEDKYLAMSPTCTHLGCQVNGQTEGGPAKDGEYFFHCPCHDSFFTKEGVPKPGVPATRPLDVYEIDQDGLKQGKVRLGPISQRKA